VRSMRLHSRMRTTCCSSIRGRTALRTPTVVRCSEWQIFVQATGSIPSETRTPCTRTTTARRWVRSGRGGVTSIRREACPTEQPCESAKAGAPPSNADSLGGYQHRPGRPSLHSKAPSIVCRDSHDVLVEPKFLIRAPADVTEKLPGASTLGSWILARFSFITSTDPWLPAKHCAHRQQR
jgi:hypothetical protein